jgi:2-polyprenyl-6-methoxyphenol hydroxylase-like FAD-dependent oxidoreductase
MKDAEVLFQMIINAESVERISLAELKRFEKIRRPEVEEQQTTQLVKEASFGKQFASV